MHSIPPAGGALVGRPGTPETPLSPYRPSAHQPQPEPHVRFRTSMGGGAASPQRASTYNPNAPAAAPAARQAQHIQQHGEHDSAGRTSSTLPPAAHALSPVNSVSVVNPPAAPMSEQQPAALSASVPAALPPSDTLRAALARTPPPGPVPALVAGAASPIPAAPWSPLVLPGTQRSIAAAAAGGAVVGGQVQYRALLAAAQAAKRGTGQRAKAFHEEMAQLDDEIDEFVGNYKFEQYAPEAALVVQTAWRAARARVFFGSYMAVRGKHLRRQMALAFLPLKQLVLAVLHARRRLLWRAFQEWREWVRLSDELFTKVRSWGMDRAGVDWAGIGLDLGSAGWDGTGQEREEDEDTQAMSAMPH